MIVGPSNPAVKGDKQYFDQVVASWKSSGIGRPEWSSKHPWKRASRGGFEYDCQVVSGGGSAGFIDVVEEVFVEAKGDDQVEGEVQEEVEGTGEAISSGSADAFALSDSSTSVYPSSTAPFEYGIPRGKK